MGARFLFVLSLVLSAAAAPTAQAVRTMTFAEARPVLAALGDSVPAALRDRTSGDADATWSAWVKQREAEIRGRIAAGDEDSVVNLMLYGTSFTRWPRATPDAIAASPAGATLDGVMAGRVADLVTAIESPGGDERLQFARQVVERHGVAVGPQSREAARRYLVELRSRVLSENERYVRRLATAPMASESQRQALHATVYRDRGLSSDTSLRIDFALDQALAALRERGELTRRAVQRVAVVGPGLDFVDKAQGYDLYAIQTIQPFAVADSLLRLGVAERPAVAALDISPRVVAHLEGAQQRARRGEPYRLNLVLERDGPGLRLDPTLVEYWRRAGSHTGEEIATEIPVEQAVQLRARAVAVRPNIVLDMTATHLNIVFERLDTGAALDLVVATNVLVYYEPCEQALAVSNMASMLRAGGLLLTNQPVPVPASAGLSPVLIVAVGFGQVETQTGPHERGDSIYVYRKA